MGCTPDLVVGACTDRCLAAEIGMTHLGGYLAAEGRSRAGTAQVPPPLACRQEMGARRGKQLARGWTFALGTGEARDSETDTAVARGPACKLKAGRISQCRAVTQSSDG